MERLAEPPQGAFYSPWTLGPRVCPGKKFSQVEFVAVLATLLRDHRVKPVLRAGETTDQARRRMLAVIEDSEVLVTPRIRRPEAAAVFWVPKRKLDNGTDTCPS